jgi:hypothetical protein
VRAAGTHTPGIGPQANRDVVLGRVGALDLDLLRAIVLTAERALGCRLFHRGPQGVKVTALGVVVLPYAKVLLSVAQTMVQAITHAQQGDR